MDPAVAASELLGGGRRDEHIVPYCTILEKGMVSHVTDRYLKRLAPKSANAIFATRIKITTERMFVLLSRIVVGIKIEREKDRE